MNQRPLVGIGVLICKDDLILLGKRRNTLGELSWAPPGGHLEFGEGFAQCAKREVLEEVGLDITDLKLITAINTYFVQEQKHYVSIMLSAQYINGEPLLKEPNKCEQWCWFPWNSLPSPLFLSLKIFVEEGYTPYVK
ncbi:MAG: MutT/nudix family protein [Chlamydiales bacterium]|jgi:8-oxo-dGTP diphosphatase|nr:MutT/nudix family protein [Chlamydiales bacterium]